MKSGDNPEIRIENEAELKLAKIGVSVAFFIMGMMFLPIMFLVVGFSVRLFKWAAGM